MKSLSVFHHHYRSGFQAHVICRPKFSEKLMGIMVDFGGSDHQPLCGGAHFLEHKLFAKPQGDIAQQFEALGAQANAFTSFNETFYYASCLDNESAVLSLLFELVGVPYFTSENVQSEKGIILQEHNMYQDRPTWALDTALMQAMFKEANLAIDLSGRPADIQAMTPEILLATYRAHYTAGNMQLVLVGDYDQNSAQRLFRQVNRLQKKYLFPSKSLHDRQELPILPSTSLVRKGSTVVGRVGVALRLPDFKKLLPSQDLGQRLTEIMLESNLGSSSSWYAKMRHEKLLYNPLDFSVTITGQGNFAMIFAISNHPEKVPEQIKQALKRPLKNLQAFEAQKKAWLAHSLREMDVMADLGVDFVEHDLIHENLVTTMRTLQVMGFETYQTLVASILAQSVIYTCSYQS